MHTETTSHSCLGPEKKETEEQLLLREGKPGLLRQWWAFVGFNSGSFAYSVQVSGVGGQEDRDGEDSTQKAWSEPDPSLTHSACTPAKSYIKTP